MRLLSLFTDKIQALNQRAKNELLLVHANVEPLTSMVVAVMQWLGHALLGQWQPPHWLQALGAGLSAIARWCLSHLAALIMTLGLAAALFAGGGTIKNTFFGLLPERNPTVIVKVTIKDPSRTEVENSGVPNPDVIRFSAAAARLALIGKEALGVSLAPR